MNGFLLVDKPLGLSSFGALKQLNRRFQIQKTAGKLGHGGTLDPNASGLLVVAIGRATRLLRFFLGSDKRYLATVKLGAQTSTDDTEGEVIAEASYAHVTQEAVVAALEGFRGTISQVPPDFSALHVDGKRAYQMARHGERPALEPRMVTIYRADLLRCELSQAEIDLDIACSGGTYIRSIARDLGLALETRAHLSALRRSRACHFNLEDAKPLEYLLEQDSLEPFIRPCSEAMAHFEAVQISEKDVHRLLHGQPVNFHLSQDGVYRVECAERHMMVAVVERKEGKNDVLRLCTIEEWDKMTEVNPCN